MRDDERVEREEHYRMYSLGRELHDVASGHGVNSTEYWRVLEFFQATADYYRAKSERVSWWMKRDQDLFDRALSAASNDKLGECLSSLYEMQKNREAALSEMKTFVQLMLKRAEQPEEQAR